MRAVLASLVFLFCFGCTTAEHVKQMAPDAVRYVIEPTTYENKPALQFTLTFVGQASGKTFLELPSRWASEKDYYKDIKNLKVLTEGVTLSNGEKPYIKVVNHPPSRIIELSYVLTEQPPQGAQPFRALITSKYFHFVGYVAFVAPNVSENISSTYEVIFKNFPEGFHLAHSFASETDHLRIRTNLGTLKRAIFLGGDYRIKTVEVRNRPLTLAVRGNWKFSDEEYFKSAAQVVESQRNFWGDDDFPYFFIALSPDRAERGSAGGTGLTNSFFMSVTPEFTLQNKIIPLLAHEFFHTWNGAKIRQADPEARYYWFSEGFTDYYSRLLNLRAGLIDLKTYVADVNEAIYFYYISPVRSAPNARIEKEFWKNSDVGQLPYYRGGFLAMNWNSKIKLDSKGERSLDGLIKSLFQATQKEGSQVNEAILTSLMEKDLPSVKGDIRSFIAQGNMVTPDEKALGPCVKREFVSLGKIVLGYDREKTYASGVVTGLKNGSPAHKAGLREGMKFLDRQIVNPPFTDSKVKVFTHGQEKWISFLPLGQKRFLMPQYKIDEKAYAKDPQKCLAWFN